MLSGNSDEWPSELILLREKLIAANQLEIAQLKIKHEEEMSRLKSELQRRQLKRNAAFDENRNLQEIISERDNLRELSESLRFTLCELAKCISQCENELNNTLQDEAIDPNISTISINTKRIVTFKPDVTNLLAVVEDPKLLDFISSKNNNKENKNENCIQINIVDYLNRLKTEANSILELTEQISQRNIKNASIISEHPEKADSCEEEDGLKRSHMYRSLSVTPKKNEMRTVDDFKSLPVMLDKSKSEVLKSGDSSSNIEDEDEHKRALIELRYKIRDLLSTSAKRPIDAYQFFEEFCRATDYFVEGENQLRDDLLRQLETADKQIKSNKKFLDEQAVERDQERDEYMREIDHLRTVLRERGEKDKSSIENYEKKLLSTYEDQIKDLSTQLENLLSQKQKFEQDLKDSIDKVFDLREIISNLEGQIQSKVDNENALLRKCEDLENFIRHQNESAEEMKIKESEYIERITNLEEQLKLVRPTNEQKLMIQQMSTQLKSIEHQLDKKIKTLEAFHALASSCSATACSSPSEDVSKGFDVENFSEKSPIKSLAKSSDSMPLEDISRILEKLLKHNRMEEATVKKVSDLEMTINVMKNNLNEIQQEKDILEERISEQLMKISSLQTRLDEQRIQSEEMNKQNNSDLTLKVHDLHNEVSNLKEILSSRDKQILNLNQLLENSKAIIERQDQELAIGNDKSSYERLNDEMKMKDDEISHLREKIKTEMVNKAVIPDLMETMMAEKNEEIDTLKEKITHLTHQFGGISIDSKQNSIESALIDTLKSDAEPDVMRHAPVPQQEYFLREHNENTVTKDQQFTLNETSSITHEALTDKATVFTSEEHSKTAMIPVHLIPRKIDFNSLEEMSANISDDAKIHNELEQACIEIDKLKTFVQEQSKEISNLQILLETKEKLYNEIIDERNESEEKLKNLQSLTIKCNAYENDMKKKNEEATNLIIKVQDLEFSLASHKQELEDLRRALHSKDELILKHSEDLVSLQNKCKENENILSDLENLREQVNSYDSQMCEKEAILKKMEVDLVNYMKNEQVLLNKAEKYDRLLDLNQQLEVDVESLRKQLCAKSFSLEKYKIDLQDMERQIHSLKKEGNEMQQDAGEAHSIVEIANKLDKEINYAAELDGHIIDAIKSESEISSELDEIGSRKTDQVQKKVKNLQFELDHYKEKYKTILNELEEERKYFNDIHQQDANLIESMNLRLKLALDNEVTFKKMLENEKLKIATLSGVQRTKSFDNNLLFKKSFTEFDLLSPRRSNGLESEVIHRLESEIKLLSSQNDCEKDRVLDLQTVVERERDRFKRTLVEQQMYIDQLKKEIQTQQNNNQLMRIELDGLRNMDVRMKPDSGYSQNIETLEEQNHYLIGRFMRSESFRKALIFQKKFLLITISTKVGISTSSLYQIDSKKRKTFRSIALLVIAIERFKFIAKRWTGKRLMPQASNFTTPKRSQSASNNNWIHNFRTNNMQPKMTQSKQSQLMRIQNLFHEQ